MSLDQNQIAQDLAQAIASINAAKDLEALKQVKIDYVGDKSPLAKANQALATVDKLLMNKDEAEEWLYSLHDIALSIDESYWNKHNFDKEVMLIVEKSYKD